MFTSTLPAITCLLLVAWVETIRTGILFQGNCADRTVLCDQLCISNSNSLYECACWDDHILLDDGITCKVKFSRITTHSTKKSILKNGYDYLKKVAFDIQNHISSEVEHDIDNKNEIKFEPLLFNSTSFVVFPFPESAYLETNITIEFRPNSLTDGLLLYAGDEEGKDFISISFIGTNIVLRFNCGEGTIEDSYGGPFINSSWHTLVVRRKYCMYSEIKIDDKRSMIDEIHEFQNYKGIASNDLLYIGGAPKESIHLLERTLTTNGFNGFIKKVNINGFDLFNSDLKINTAIAKSFQPDSAPLVSLQNMKVESDVPEFVGKSLIKLSAPEDIDVYIDLHIEIKAKEKNGLIYFHGNQKHYLALYLREAYIQVKFALGDDSITIRSIHKISLNKWHLVELWRSGRAILLKVKDQPWVDGEVNSIKALTSKVNHIYIGGILSGSEGEGAFEEIEGFFGCIRKVRENGHDLHLMENPLEMRMVRRCDWKPCNSKDCGRNAKCLNYRSEGQCLCPYPSYGSNCEYKHIEEKLTEFGFNHFSYIQLTKHQFMKYITGEYFNITLSIRPSLSKRNQNERNEVILSAGEESELEDYLQLSLAKTKEVMFSINLGSGALTITHPSLLTRDHWHRINIYREKQTVSLTLNTTTITSLVPGSSIELNVYDSLQIGGITKPNSESVGFSGCIRDLYINDIILTDISTIGEAVNICKCN